jgi:hypothetical protein
VPKSPRQMEEGISELQYLDGKELPLLAMEETPVGSMKTRNGTTYNDHFYSRAIFSG